MLNDSELDALTQPIINIYSQIERELIVEIASRFDTYDSVGGSLRWQLKKLDEMGNLNNELVSIISHYSSKTDKEIVKMLNDAGYANIDLSAINKSLGKAAISVEQLASSPVIKDVMELSFKEIKDTYRLINTKALENAKQAYMDVINQSYLEVSSGIYDYQTSIKRGIQKMAAQGISGATYKRGDTIVNYSIEATVRRDTLTAVHKVANKISEASCKELGTDYVEISSHLGARVSLIDPIANHAGWQGKVFKIHGFDKEYGNLKNNTGYPDDILGLGGVNCRHRMFPFFPGISKPNPIQYDEKENKKAYYLSQKQKAYERDIRKLKKQEAAAVAMGDKETARLINDRLNKKNDELNNFCKQNGLKRDYSRELVIEQLN